MPEYSIADQLDAATRALSETVDPARRQTALAAALADFSPEGRWRFAPAAERERAQRTVEGEQRRRAGEQLFALDRLAHEAGELATKAESLASEPADAESAFLQRAGKAGLTLAESLNLQVLDELRRQRLDRELDTARPTDVLRRYREAVQDPSEQSHATLIRVIESRLQAGGWPSSQPGEAGADADAVSQLLATWRDARAARVPQHVKDLRARVAVARKLSQEVRDLHKIDPRRVF